MNIRGIPFLLILLFTFHMKLLKSLLQSKVIFIIIIIIIIIDFLTFLSIIISDGEVVVAL